MVKARAPSRLASRLWPWVILLLGLALSVGLALTLHKRARAAWQLQAEHETAQHAVTLLSWMEESFTLLSGLVVLVENSNSVQSGEFYNAVDGMESRARVNLLSSKALLARQGSRWRVRFASSAVSADPAFPATGKAPAEALGQLLAQASDSPNEWLMSAPFADAAGKQHVYVALVTINKPDLALAGVFDIEQTLNNLVGARRLEGLRLDVGLKPDSAERKSFFARCSAGNRGRASHPDLALHGPHVPRP